MFTRTFIDRIAAAETLATCLQAYRGRNPLILAIPRSAVPMGKILAERLEGELDVVLVHKLGAPLNPEFAIGAIDETGWSYFSPAFEDDASNLIEQAKSRQLAALKSQRARFTPFAQPIDQQGRVVIVVDDGMATGATMLAALHVVRAKKPSELVCAVPVASPGSLKKVAPLTDKIVCLSAPRHFGTISQYYAHFPTVEEEEVIRILASTGRAGKHR